MGVPGERYDRAGASRGTVMLRIIGVLLLGGLLLAACTHGPRTLEQGQLAYNEATKAAVDEEPVSYTHLTLPTIYSV